MRAPGLPSLSVVPGCPVWLCHLLLAALPLVAACPKDPPSPPGLSSSSGGSNNSNGGFDAGVISNNCTRDQDCAAGMVCGSADAGCVAGLACVAGSALCGECDVGGSRSCGFPRAPAYCDATAGVCRRILATCGRCTADEQCGEDPVSGEVNKCVAYGSDGTFCGMACRTGSCGRGFDCVDGACKAAASVGSCVGALTCTTDEECPLGKHCTTRGSNPPKEGVCLAFCLEDRECAAGKICKNDPGPSYGQCIQGCAPGTVVSNQVCHDWGRFGPFCPATPCPEGYDCTRTTEGHCEQQGCDNDLECPLPRTICDVPNRTCVPGCKTAANCGAFELCQDGTCVPQGCRGKELSCNIGQFCCGTELYSTDGGQPCPDGVSKGQCFNFPDPFCRRCEKEEDCADITSFGFPSHCYDMQQPDADGGTTSLGKFCSVGCRSNMDCPRAMVCNMDLPSGENGETTQGCLDYHCLSTSGGPGE